MPDENKMIVRHTQEQAGYTPVSTVTGAACSGCRWFIGAQAGGPACHVIENFPLDISDNGYCNKFDNVEDAILEQIVNVEPTPVVLVQEMAHGQTTDTQHEFETADGYIVPKQDGYIAPDSNDTNMLKSLLDKFKHGMKPGLSVLKDAAGRRYMLIVTSNSYQDRDSETITTDALKADTERHWIADDVYKSDNPLLFWHEDNLAIGDIVFGDVRGPFLVELAREGDTPLAHKMFDYIEQHPEEKWGASHRFGYRDNDRTNDGEFKRIYKKETSVLPRKHAANLLTYSGVLPMSKERNAFVDKMLGLEGAMDILEKEGIQALVAKLQVNGVNHKSADGQAEETPVTAEADKGYLPVLGKLIEGLIQSQADISEELETAKSALTVSQKAYDDGAKALQVALEETKAMQAALKEQLDARPRMASRDPNNAIQNDELKQEFTRPQVKIDPTFGVRVKE